MLHKKISLPLLPFTCLLLAGCPGNNSSSSSSSTTEDSNKVNDNQPNSGKPALSILSSELQASLSCKEGAEKKFLLPCKGKVSNIDVDGQIAFIGVPAGIDAKSSRESAIKESSVKDKSIQLCDNGCFIYWTNLDGGCTGTKQEIILVDEKTCNLLASKEYRMHMAYLPKGASAKDAVFSADPCKIDTKETDLSIPPWENVGLKAVEYSQKQVDNGTAYFLKGTASNTDLLSDETNTKMGFILVEQEKLSNIYDWVQTVITSENGWPTEAMQFSEGITIVPGKFRTSDPHIVADLSPQDQPIQKGKYTMLCYLIQDNQHYYLSQMEHVMGDATEETPSKPPTIEFDGSTHGLQVVDLKLVRDKISDRVKSVKFSEGAKIEYSVNGQVEELPAHLQSALLFVPRGTMWRTSILESLFEDLQTSGRNASITNDKSIFLISDLNEPLDPSFTDFFNGTDYQYFACLFSKENNKLHFYTQKEILSIEDKVAINKPQPQPLKPKPEETPKQDVLKIALNNEGANIDLPRFGRKNNTKYKLPEVVFEPSNFNQNELTHQGFVIAKTEDLNSEKMDDYNSTIQDFIKNSDTNKALYNNERFLIFEKDSALAVSTLYDRYISVKDQHVKDLTIAYWAQYKNKIVWSKPVSIALK